MTVAGLKAQRSLNETFHEKGIKVKQGETGAPDPRHDAFRGKCNCMPMARPEANDDAIIS